MTNSLQNILLKLKIDSMDKNSIDFNVLKERYLIETSPKTFGQNKSVAPITYNNNKDDNPPLQSCFYFSESANWKPTRPETTITYGGQK